MSTSPSVGQTNGSAGSSQKAGQMPVATGAVMCAVRQPRGRPRVACDVRRAEVYCSLGEDRVESMMARRMREELSWKEFDGEET